jgi:hypothetical protein
MSSEPKTPLEASPEPAQSTPPGPAPSKSKVQFGPTPSAPGSRLKKTRGS